MEIQVTTETCKYNIYIDSWEQKLSEILFPFKFSSKVLLITDKNVVKFYGQYVTELFREMGFTVHSVVVDPGEGAKSFPVAEQIFTEAIRFGLDRHSPIIALGGGVVGDLAGFIAANYMRGVPFIQIPTSLLAQVDSSVGGKVAINHPLGKNLIGAFYQPKAVFMETDWLKTLPPREFYTGMAEVIKYGAIMDSQFFDYLLSNSSEIINRNQQAMRYIISSSCKMKAEIVESDEKESGVRMILNFGHTVGHAIEAATNFSRYTHGEAVAIGMYAAAKLSLLMGLCSETEVALLKKCLNQYQLPLNAVCSAEQILPYVSQDKKNTNGEVSWVLLKEIGSVTISSAVPNEVVMKVLQDITH